MKKFLVLTVLFIGMGAQAKLKDHEVMKCIDGDKPTRSIFQDLQAAYEMRIVSAKDFFDVMDKAKGCPQLKRDLKKLQARAISQFSAPKRPSRDTEMNNHSFENTESVPAPAATGNIPAFPPPPPDFDELGNEFNDFR